MSVEFEDNSMKVKGMLDEAVMGFLYEAAGELEAQVKRNTRVDTGKTKGSWQYRVDESKQEAVIGSMMENAIWEEFGTGEYAVNGDGRKGGWAYIDSEGKGHFTYGKKPTRTLQKAFTSKKDILVRRAENILKTKFN